jgi:hypothetical protein
MVQLLGSRYFVPPLPMGLPLLSGKVFLGCRKSEQPEEYFTKSAYL